MGFNLRNWLEESIADVNPFDNGATAQTVRANRTRPQPAQTVRRPSQSPGMLQVGQARPQSLSMGSSQMKPSAISKPLISPVVNSNPKPQVFGQSSDPLKVGQVKTPQIQTPVQQSAAQQAPMMLKPEARQTWAQKQPVNPATLKVQKPSLISQTPKSIGQVGTFANDNLVKPALDVANKSANTVGVPLAGLAGGAAIAQDKLFNNGRNFNNLAKATNDQVNELQRNSWVSNKIASGKASPVEFAKGFTEAGVQTSQFVPAGRVLTGAQKAGGLTAPLVKNILGTNAKMAGVYGTSTIANDALQGREVNPVSVAAAYAAPFALGAGSEMAGVVGRQAGRAVKNLPDNVAAQQAEKLSGLPKANVLNDNEAFTLSDFGDYLGKRHLTDTTNPKVVQDINQLHMQARHAAKNAGIDVISGTPRDIQMRIADYLEQRDYYKQGFKAVRQGGYAKIPGSQDAGLPNVPIDPRITKLSARKSQLEEQIAKMEARQEGYRKTDMPGVFQTGRDGVSSSRLRKLEQQTNRTIDNAVEYTKVYDELKSVNSSIEGLRNAPARAAQEAKTLSRQEQMFNSLKPGDEVDVGGNGLITVAKVNKSSITTPSGSKYKIDEIYGIKKQQGVHDSLADNLPNPVDKPIIPRDDYINNLAGGNKITYNGGFKNGTVKTANKKTITLDDGTKVSKVDIDAPTDEIMGSYSQIPKQDLIIKNGEGKAMSIEPKDPTAALKAKAEPKPKTAFEKNLEDAGIKPKLTKDSYVSQPKDVKRAIDAKMLNDDEASQKAIGTQGLQNSKSGQRQSQGKRMRPTNQGTLSRSSQRSGRQNPLPDNKARTGRTYPDNTPDIDTAQYVKDMGRSQKSAMQSESGIKAKAADFKEKFIDDLSPIEDRLNKAIKDGASVDVKDHITYQLDRSRRAEGVMNAYVRDNGLDKIIQSVDNVDEFDQYLIARHAKELDEDVLTGRDIAKDAALVRQLEGKYGEKAKELYAYNQKLLDTSVDYGLISKESAAALKKQYPDYVPFNRIFNEDELANLYGGAGKGDASLSSQNVVKKIKGSNRAIASPLNSIIDKTRVVVEQGERNRAAQMLANYRELPGNPYNLKEIPKNETIGTRHTISYLDKGVKRTFETDKVIADAAKNMTRQEIGLWGRIAAVPARVLRGGATTVNIGFAGANVVKDVIGAAINSKHPFRIADPKAFGKALSAALEHDGPYYQELMREGVAGTSFDMYRNPLKSNIGEIRSHKNLGTRAAYNVTHPSQWYRTLENTIGRSEDFGRALQYYSNKSGFEAKLGKGSKDAKTLAADQARHNSTNFFRHGSAGKGINLAIPYWNAGVQGARIQTRRIAERPVQTVAKIGFAIAAPSAMIAMNNYSTPERQEIMDNIQDYEKEGNIIILGANPHMNQETGKWEDVYKIPVPPQHIGIHTAVQDAVRSAKTGEGFDVLKNLGKITQNYTTVNPTNLRETASSYTPQALKLVAEPMTNTNFFTGNKIVPESQKNLPAKDQFGDYTSGTAKILGGITNISPRQIDNAIRTGTGGAGQNALWASDKMLAGTGAIEAKDVKGQDPLTSITRRFSGAASVSASDKAENLFKKYKEQVVQSNEYKNASQYDKQRMLNRLQNDLSAVEWDKTGKSEKNLTGKQEALKSDGFDPSVYTNLDSKTANKGTPKEKYESALKDYESKKATLNDVEKFKKEKELKILKVKSNFDGDVVSLWGMSKADIYELLTKDKDGNRKAEQLIKLDQAMYDAGLTKYLTFRNGIAPAKSGRKSTGGRKVSSGRKSTGGRKTSNKGKFDYKLFGFSGGNGTSNSKQLHDLLKKARMKV